MKIRQRRITAVIGLVMSFLLVTSFLAAGALPAPVQPAPADRADSGSIAVTRGVGGATIMDLPSGISAASVAAAEPRTSPAARQRYWIPGGTSIVCEDGYACAVAPYGNGGFLFKFWYYGTYGLSNWFCCGAVANSQTGGAAMRLLDRNGGQLQCWPAGTGNIGINWDPVWYIRLTSSPC